MIKIPCDPHVAKELASQIDPCGFRSVRAHYRNPSSEITQVVLVQGDYRLEEVAAFFAAPPAGSTEEDLLALLDAGVIKFGVDDIQGVRTPFIDHAVLLDSIPADQLCYVIYLPPVYMVRVTGEKYR